MIDLFYYTSPNARKILIALEELAVPYNLVWTNISEGDQFPARIHQGQSKWQNPGGDRPERA